jgi:enterobacterial common antigen flippase
MKFLHASLMLGFSTAVRTGANLLVVKLIAHYLGTDGMGYLGQFMSVVALMSALAGGGISMGITKYVAQQGARQEAAIPYIRAAFAIWASTSAAFFVLIAANARLLSQLLFDSPDHYGVFWGVAGCQALIGAYNVLTAVVNGKHNVAGLAAVNTLSAIAGAAITSVLILTAGLTGAMWGLMLAPCTGLVFVGWVVWKNSYLRGPWQGQRAQAVHYRDLLAFASMLVVSVSTMPVAQIVLRKWQGDALGWDQVGIWQGLVKLSDAYLQFVMIVLANHYFPRLSRSADHRTLHAEFKTTLIACAAGLVPVTLCIWLLREPVIRLLFSSQFLPMQELLWPQLLGDVFRTLAYVASYVAVAKAKTSLYVAAEIYQAGALLLLSHFLIPVFGAKGVPYAYCATYLFYCLVCLTAYWRYHVIQVRAAS